MDGEGQDASTSAGAASAVTEAGVAGSAGIPAPRTPEALEAVVRPVHALVPELRPTLETWRGAVDFLSAVRPEE